jgi:hypothetical protein
MLSMREQVCNIIDTLADIEKVHVETFFFSKKFCQGSDENLILRGAIYQLLSERKILYQLHGPTHWKKFITGRVRPSPADIAKHGKSKAPKGMVVDALNSKFDIHFSSHTRINGKRVQFKYDISDAVGIGIYGIKADTPGCTIAPYRETGTGEIVLQLGDLLSSDREPPAVPRGGPSPKP